jgi:hypothetical protein
LPTKVDVHDRVRNTCNAAIIDGDQASTLAGYLTIATELIPEAAVTYADVSGVGEASLQNIALAHAAEHLLGTEIDPPKFRRLAALRKQHGNRVYEALATAAVAASGDPISYATSILKKEMVR